MELTDAEKAQLKALIDAGEPLPDEYRFRLFGEPREAELVWPGRPAEVTSVVLPFQSIEQVDEPRTETEIGTYEGDLFSVGTGGRQTGGWANKLIWGDNKLVLASLRGGPLRQEIERAGGLKLVYIDPPFDVGADFSFNVEVGDALLTKQPRIIEDIAYRDTWGRGSDSFLSMLSERITLIRELMAPDASIYVHADNWVGAYVRLVCESIFGPEQLQSQIIWKRTSAHSDAAVGFGDVTDSIYFFTKSDVSTWNRVKAPLDDEHVASKYTYVDGDGRRYATRDLRSPHPRPNLTYVYKGYRPHANGWSISLALMQKYDQEGKLYFPKNEDGRIRLKIYLGDSEGVPLQNLWTQTYRQSIHRPRKDSHIQPKSQRRSLSGSF